jgi:hypothetical protein
MDVYLYYDGEQYGPCTLDELAEMWAAGQIPAESFCWHAGLDQWVRSAKFKRPRTDIPPPPTALARAQQRANLDAFGPPAANTTACAYCHGAIDPAATRCAHCQGELMPCPTCRRNVAVNVVQKFVGFARGGSIPVHKCRTCGKQLSGPRL